MQIDTRSTPLTATNSADSTATSIVFPVPTITKPSGDGVITMGDSGELTGNAVDLIPFGVGSATNTFLMAVYGWRIVRSSTIGFSDLWVARTLAKFTCTLCTVPGLVATAVDNTHLFVGTIALTFGNANVSVETLSPTGNEVASITLDAKGAAFLSVLFSTNSSATAMNCLYATL